MRPVRASTLFAFALLAPAPALAQAAAAPAATVAAGDAAPAKPVTMGAPAPKPPEPRAPVERPGPQRRALAVTIEILSPLGAAGCFYRRRAPVAVIVAAGSLLAGSLLLYAVRHGDPDGTIVGAVAYGAMRGIGLASAIPASAAPPSSPGDPAPRAPAAPTLGLWHRFSF